MNNVEILFLIGKFTWIHKEDKKNKKEILQLTRCPELIHSRAAGSQYTKTTGAC